MARIVLDVLFAMVIQSVQIFLHIVFEAQQFCKRRRNSFVIGSTVANAAARRYKGEESLPRGTHMKCWILGALALAAWSCVLCAHVRAQDLPAPQDQNLITMNFQDVDIPVLAKFISEITGKNFVVDESVRGKVSIISPTKVTPAQAYSIFQSVLQVKGFTTVQAGPVIKIVPAREVRESAALTTSQEPGESRGDSYVTRMVRLKNIDAGSLVNVIQPMISGLVFGILRTVWLKLPSASKIPARYPAHHSLVGWLGHPMTSRIHSTRQMDWAPIACIALFCPTAALNRNSLVATPKSKR